MTQVMLLTQHKSHVSLPAVCAMNPKSQPSTLMTHTVCWSESRSNVFPKEQNTADVLENDVLWCISLV